MSRDQTVTERGNVSEVGTKMDESDMDRMVQRASVPNLASLFKQGKDKGLIKPTSNYGGAAGS